MSRWLKAFLSLVVVGWLLLCVTFGVRAYHCIADTWGHLRAIYHRVSEHEFLALWVDSPEATKLYTRPCTDKWLNRSFDRMTIRALDLGLLLEKPRLVETNGFFDLWHQRWRTSGYARVSDGGALVVADQRWLGSFTDDELDCAFAHELGHVVALQTQRKGHPAFLNLQCAPDQVFADSIGLLICGSDRWHRFYDRHIIAREPAPGPCDSGYVSPLR